MTPTETILDRLADGSHWQFRDLTRLPGLEIEPARLHALLDFMIHKGTISVSGTGGYYRPDLRPKPSCGGKCHLDDTGKCKVCGGDLMA